MPLLFVVDAGLLLHSENKPEAVFAGFIKRQLLVASCMPPRAAETFRWKAIVRQNFCYSSCVHIERGISPAFLCIIPLEGEEKLLPANIQGFCNRLRNNKKKVFIW